MGGGVVVGARNVSGLGEGGVGVGVGVKEV